jgi:hypothetical protein
LVPFNSAVAFLKIAMLDEEGSTQEQQKQLSRLAWELKVSAAASVKQRSSDSGQGAKVNGQRVFGH